MGAAGALRLRVEDLGVSLGGRRVVDGVSFDLAAGEAVALVGESGSGKSTIGRLLARLLPAESGRLFLEGRDVFADEPREASLNFRSVLQLVFQDPFASLNPVHTVGHHLVRPLVRHGRASSSSDARTKALALLSTVGLEPAEAFIDLTPGALSGGQRQRVAIARALAPTPDVLVADEPTSMLDASVRAGVLSMLDGLVKNRGLSLLFITHDLASARLLCDRVLVLHRGRIVESGPGEDVFHAPSHPYTRALVEALPRGVPRRVEASSTHVVTTTDEGCSWRSRCREATEACAASVPSLVSFGQGRAVRCHARSEPLRSIA